MNHLGYHFNSPYTIDNDDDDDNNNNASCCNVVEIRGEVVFPESIFHSAKKNTQMHKNNNIQAGEDDDDKQELQQETTKKDKDGEEEDSSSSSLRLLQNFSNPRNAASGILLRKEETVESRRIQSYLKFYAYDIIFLSTTTTTNTKRRTNDDDNDHTNGGGSGSSSDDKDKEEKETVHVSPPLLQLRSGVELRQLLNELGFRLPMPFVTTKLTLPPPSTTAIKALNNVWNDSDIVTMINYYEQLKLYRQKDHGGVGATDDSMYISNNNNKTTQQQQQQDSSAEWNDDVWGDYEMDGCVHKVDNMNVRTQMGSSNRAPRWAVAHKFPAQAVVTRLMDVDVQVGRTGVLTPVALLEPVELEGISIQRATLHNFGKMRQLLLQDSDNSSENKGGSSSATGHNNHSYQVPVGVSVMVRRAGDVIPQVFQRVGSSNRREESSNSSTEAMISLATPETCPACGSPVIVEEEISGSSSLEGPVRCGGPMLLCEPRALANLAYAFSRDALDVKGLSEGRLRQLKQEGLVQVPNDLFELAQNETEFVEKLSNLHGWGEKSATKLATELNTVATKGVSLSRFIRSLGIRFIGQHTSTLVGAAYKSANVFLADMEHVSLLEHPELESFPILRKQDEATKGIGPSLLNSITEFAQDPSMVEAVSKLKNAIRVLDEAGGGGGGVENDQSSMEQGDGPFNGLNVVFTGALPGITRKEARSLAKQMGAKKTSNNNKVTKLTDLVVVGSKAARSTLADAQLLNIRIVDADEFADMVKSIIAPQNNSTQLLESSSSTPTTKGRTKRKVPKSADKDDKLSLVGKGQPLHGMTVVFTGSIPRMTRKQAQELALQQMGARATSVNVTKLTDLVISGRRAGKKVMDQAKLLGVRVMEADEFVELAKQFE